MMRIYKEKDYDSMSKRAADIMAAQIMLKPECVLGLATGSTPIGLYKNLVSMYNEGVLDFSKVRTVNLDEYRGLGVDHPQSYHYFMCVNLFSKVNIDENNINIPDGTLKDANMACKKYDDVIKNMGGIDMQLLGIGHNGHIGFNEPSDFFAKDTNCVKLTQSTISANSRFFDDISEVPKEAYTMGIGSIMAAKTVLLVANSKDKAEILKEALLGKITPMVPASILQLHPNLIVVGDEVALKEF